MPQAVLKLGEERMEKAILALNKELSQVKTGRANPALLNNVHVSYYGVETPLNQICAISVPEAQVIVIKPYDKGILKDIEKAIQLADLDLNPLNDGTVIRINFPSLTEQTRKELVKGIKSTGEASKIGLRNIRREIVDQMKKLEKDSIISEDELKRQNEKIQKLTDKYIENIDAALKAKEAQLMEI